MITEMACAEYIVFIVLPMFLGKTNLNFLEIYFFILRELDIKEKANHFQADSKDDQTRPKQGASSGSPQQGAGAKALGTLSCLFS